MAKHKAEHTDTHSASPTLAPASDAPKNQTGKPTESRLNSDGNPFLRPPSEHLEHIARLLDDARQMPLLVRR